MTKLRSAVLIDELHFGPRTYSSIRVGEPIQSHDGIFRVPVFDERSFLWNLIELHPELSMLHFTVSQSTPGKDAGFRDRLVESLVNRGHAIRTPYSYANRRVRDAVPVFLASGALKRFLEDPSSSVAEAERAAGDSKPSAPAQAEQKSKPLASKLAPKITGDAYQVFFIDDIGDATALSEPLATHEEAVQWEKDYWKAYFEEHPGTVLYFCSSEVRSVFVPKETP